jgi:hypothetical protein
MLKSYNGTKGSLIDFGGPHVWNPWSITTLFEKLLHCVVEVLWFTFQNRRKKFLSLSSLSHTFLLSLLSLSTFSLSHSSISLFSLPLSSLYPSLSHSPPLSTSLSLTLWLSFLSLSPSSLPLTPLSLSYQISRNALAEIIDSTSLSKIDFLFSTISQKNGEYFVKEQQGFFANTVKPMGNDHIRDPNFVLVVLGRALLFRGSLML